MWPDRDSNSIIHCFLLIKEIIQGPVITFMLFLVSNTFYLAKPIILLLLAGIDKYPLPVGPIGAQTHNPYNTGLCLTE